ncbi:unnamed protein product [Rotaria magnacalcarata]|uniref:J domain-containing protein n=2 Tax=Rotaria magnacalcarata TaxID=392030 RepID=A0A816S781_9BILA|nr:unnamed protein product [Rotaria magnacalcarata]CAF2082091.1 unnamed protein product [Rotaria magnacalcarata]CAF2098063.1 unnamed protein product [Rotaria magnacalcarata]CAF3809737.1 unnamed protein product [Rotaria magnacalcarata]CAF3820484.1 unnamed protein product [Rotaria magnacalcarata]
MAKDYYEILQVTRIAKDADINSSYRRLALKFHPARNPDDLDALYKFHDLAEAYDVLSDPQKRAIYDQYGNEGLKRGVPTGTDGEWTEDYVFHGNAEKIFRDFFGGDNPFMEFYTTADQNRSLGFGGIDGRGRVKKDPPIVRDLLLSLEDCYHGAIKKIKISRRVLNDDGITSNIREKILSISVKRGWLPGTKIIFEGEGDQGPNNIPSDLVFTVKDKPHPIFRRENSDLIYTAKITLGYALVGITLHIEHLDGRILDVPINDIVRPGYKKRIPGHGMPLMTDPDKYGDIIIDFDVEYPIGLSPDQKLFIKEALINNLNNKKQQQQHANHFKKKHLFHED